MFITQKKFDANRGKKELTLTLMSDLHFGAPNVDYERMREDLEGAKQHGDRILLDGDVFDMILPGDMKRYVPEALDPRLQGRSEIINRVIDFGFEFLRPYAPLIDLMATGNHEESVQKYHHFDPVQALVYRLNQLPGTDIHYGGICGFMDYQVKVPWAKGRSGTRWRYLIYYHHGAGGAALVTKGMIEFNRMETWLDCDLIWIGHKHNRILDATTKRVTLSANGHILERPFRAVMTGGYFTTGEDTHASYMGGEPRKVNYAEWKNLPPQDTGGCRVIVPFLNNAGIGRVRIVM
jgi:hypothetical protein